MNAAADDMRIHVRFPDGARYGDSLGALRRLKAYLPGLEVRKRPAGAVLSGPPAASVWLVLPDGFSIVDWTGA